MVASPGNANTGALPVQSPVDKEMGLDGRAGGRDLPAKAPGRSRKKPANTLSGLGSGARLAKGSVNIASTDLAFGEGEALRVEDVMRILHLSRNTVYKLAREGVLPSYRVGRQIRFRYDDVRRQLEGEAARTAGRAARPEPLGPDVLAPAARAARAPSARASIAGAHAAAGALEPPDQSSLPEPYDNGDILDELPAWARGSIIIGGQDLAGDVIANYAAGLGVKVLRSHSNGYVSLARMYMGTCQAAVVDLWSENERRYNASYMRQMLPGVPAILFRLYKCRVGLTMPARNPLRMRSWVDLLKPDVVLANREHGAGTRVLLDEKLKYMEADGSQIKGYDRAVGSELAQALLVARGLANVAVTTEKPCRQIKGLAFLPMQDEYVGLAVLRTPQTASFIRAVRSLLRTDAFRSEFDPTLYDVDLMGEIVYEC